MSIMSILYAPFGWVLSFFYSLVGNYAFALILFTIFTRVLLLPMAVSQQKSGAKQSRITGKANKIRARYAGDNERINKETQAMYEREGFNPMNAGCFPLLIQFPIMMGLYGVIYSPLTYVLRIPTEIVATLTEAYKTFVGGEVSGRAASHMELGILRNFPELAQQNLGISADVMTKIQSFDFTFMGLHMGDVPDLKVPSALWVIPILAGVTSLLTSLVTFIRQRQSQQGGDQQNALMMGCMSFGMPLFSLYIAFQLPIGIGLYWIMSNIFAFFQTLILGHLYAPEKVLAKTMVEETIEKRSYEKAISLASEHKEHTTLAKEFQDLE